MSEFFISYTQSGSQWAHWIALDLRDMGHIAHVHEWEVKPGEDIFAWMERHHDAADHVLCVVSDAYLQAPYSTLERNAAVWATAKDRPGFVIFVVVQPCTLPTLTDHMRRCELHDLPEDAARARFRAFMAEPVVPGQVVFPGSVAVSNISISVPQHFLGRDDAMAAIEATLARFHGRVAITAVHGMRGVGKTTLAAAYAEKHRTAYRATWWIRAQTPDGMTANLISLGIRLGWFREGQEDALDRVKERLRHEGEGILLIYDNAPNARALTGFLPVGGAAQVLVTSNDHAWRGSAEPVEIQVWPKEIGADFLVRRTGRTAERAAAEVLSYALVGLPLAHEMAAAWCEVLERPLADYHQRLLATPVRQLDDAEWAPDAYHDRRTVAQTFSLAIEEAAQLHLAAERLLVQAALLQPRHRGAGPGRL